MIVRLLAPHAGLVDEIIRHLRPQGRDYSENLVVFPGKRPAHYLRREIGRQLGGSYIPPAILSMDSMIEQAYASLGGDRIIGAMDAVSLLHDIHGDAGLRIGAAGFETLDAFFPVGLKIFRDIEELQIEQIPFSRVRSCVPLTELPLPGRSRDRMLSLADYAERFYAEVKRRGCSTRSTRYREVADRAEQTCIARYGRIVFAGFFGLTSSERTLFRKLGEQDGTVFIFQSGPGMDEQLAAVGFDHQEAPAEGHEPEIRYISSPDVHGEVCALGEQIGPLRGGRLPDEDTAIVLPSAESLFPLLRHALQDFDERSFNVTLGYPLSRTPLFGFLHALSELVTSMDGDRVYLPSYLAYVLHPYTKNIYFSGSAEVTRILFHTIEENLSKRTAITFLSLAEIESDTQFFEDASRRLASEGHSIKAGELRSHLAAVHISTITPFFSIGSIRDFAVKCISLLSHINDNSTARLHPLFYPFVEAFVQSLDAVACSLLGGKRFSEASGYFAFFRKCLMTGHVPFDGTPLRGLQVLGVLETRGLRFDRVFVLDSNEGILPDTGREDSLLPARARELLGMPTYRDRDRLAHYYFSVLVRGAREVTLLYIENDRMEKSRFVSRLIWEQEKKDGAISGDRAVPSVRYRVHLANPDPGPIVKTAAMTEFLRDFAYSPSALDTYMGCPMQFYYRFVLGLGSPPENSGGIERADIGRVVHDALAHYLGKRRGTQLRPGDLDAREIEAVAAGLFSALTGEQPRGSGYLLMRQVQRRLAEFNDAYLSPLAANHSAEIIGVEEQMSTQFRGFRLRGRLDAVLRLDGRITLIDFKTSSNRSAYRIMYDRLVPEVRETWAAAIGSLQMPVYRHLASAAYGVPVDEIDARYLLLGTARIGPDIELPLFGDEAEQSAGSAALEEVIAGLLAEIVDPDIPFAPAGDLRRDCASCDYAVMCGTQWAVR